MLFGRDDERARIGALLDAARMSRSGALVVRGDPGIGKSALLEDARDRSPDMHVLAARGVESESELAFAALHQLLRPALTHLDDLPPPQAAALGGALGLSDGARQERFLVFAACLSLLSELAERRPVLCLVDDAHWLDAASADALRFVARRLEAEGIVLLFGAREGDVRTFDAPDIPSLHLGGLDAEAASVLLDHGAGVTASAAVRERLVERTRGNALALLEVPSMLTAAQLEGREPLPEALPMTHQVELVFLERVRRLPEEAQRALLLAAADDLENAAVVARAAERIGLRATALDAAEEAELVSIRGSRIEFRHPLVRSAVYESAKSSDRRAAHRALADVLGNEHADRRAWHLAASVLEPDESVVAALEEAAARAESRGGHLAAARALERAAELSPDPGTRGRRLARASRAASVAGSFDRAVALAHQAEVIAEDPLSKAQIARTLAVVEIMRGRPLDRMPQLLSAAADVAPLDHELAIELLVYTNWAASDAGDLATQREAARLAALLRPPDAESRFFVDFLVGIGEVGSGDAARGLETLRGALAWAETVEEELPAYLGGACALWLGDDELVESLGRRAIALSRARGSFGVLCGALGLRASQRFIAQDFDEAALAANEAVQLARELSADNLSLIARGVLASVAAVRGRDDEVHRHANDVLVLASARGLALRVAAARRALALLELGRGRWVEASEHLDAVVAAVPRYVNAYIVVASMPDRVEAAVRAGRLEVGRNSLAVFEAWASEMKAPWAKARLASCRALLAEGDEATALFEQALADPSRSRPLDLARMRLLYGEHLRRERRRADARLHQRAALEGVEALRAEPWAARAESELRATGQTARRRDPSTVDQLTPQELQIVRFVADGMSNKEIATQLFLSKRTIDYHLRNVFAKLGITSRTQLVRMHTAGDEPSVAEAAI